MTLRSKPLDWTARPRRTERQTVRTIVVPLVVAGALVATSAIAQDTPPPRPIDKSKYSPYPAQNFPNRVFYGDTHLHTSYSTDAGMLGNTLGPEEAYRFARGETVTSSTGLPARLRRPLDFLVVSDHSENLGLASAIAESNPDLLKTEFGKRVHDLVKAGKGPEAFDAWMKPMATRDDPLKGSDLARSMWQRITGCRREVTTRPGPSRPSSASSGHRCRMATTCTAT
jgi:hypothetical protein